MKRTKAGLSAPFMLIAGILIFVILFFSSCNAIKEALRNYDNSIKSTDEFIAALKDVASKQPGSYKLVPLNIDKESAIYIFSAGKDAIIEDITNAEIRIDGVMSTEVIAKPEQCKDTSDCVCLCNSFSLKMYAKDSAEWEKLSNEYSQRAGFFSDGASYYKLDCKQLVCQNVEGIKIQEETKLENIIYNYDEYMDSYKEVVFIWNQGFSMWNTDEIKYRKKESSQAKSNYVDVFIIKNSDGTLRLCYDSNCKEA